MLAYEMSVIVQLFEHSLGKKKKGDLGSGPKHQAAQQRDGPLLFPILCRTGFKRWPKDFPDGSVAKSPCSQCGGPKFNPWSRNQIPHATTKIKDPQLRPDTAK